MAQMGMAESVGGLISTAVGTSSKYGTSEMKVPEYTPVSVGTAQENALNANLTNWGKITSVTKAANKLSSEELLASMERISPGITATMNQATGTMQSWMRGELPKDVQQAIVNAGASSAVEGGFAGSS